MNRRELAKAMRDGIKTKGVRESQTAYITVWERRKLCLACALGCALIGKYNGDYLEAARAWRGILYRNNAPTAQGVFTDLLNVPITLVLEVEERHLSGDSIEQIASWLESPEETEVKA